MKKFSWIFALILALSMAFVFAGCGEEPGNPGTYDGFAIFAPMKAVIEAEGGIEVKRGNGPVTYDADRKVATIEASGSTMFYVEKDFSSAAMMVSITYSMAVVSGSADPKVVVKKGKNSWTDLDSLAGDPDIDNPFKYPELEQGKDKKLSIPVGYFGSNRDGISFQHNAYDNAGSLKYVIKITDISFI